MSSEKWKGLSLLQTLGQLDRADGSLALLVEAHLALEHTQGGTEGPGRVPFLHKSKWWGRPCVRPTLPFASFPSVQGRLGLSTQLPRSSYSEAPSVLVFGHWGQARAGTEGCPQGYDLRDQDFNLNNSRIINRKWPVNILWISVEPTCPCSVQVFLGGSCSLRVTQ